MILKNNHLTQFEMQSLEKGKTTFRKQKKKNGKILVIVMYAKQDQLFYEQKKKKMAMLEWLEKGYNCFEV